ncbi:hypothetical protein ADN00_13645 [Ornatilinea apprima]|uniref:Glycosyltransferase RgtA/B/C/D-like domain-containing protein n=1 Tax=Ornatilinea apprima TaxID=1134406 RepID=A0A0P6WVQ1_9CHLR|nr:hypothetical protein [Ornatilinea apprima]KPL74340.1 hypothetical protein ADN00_13645 [Ornatilinea apprima]
MTQSAGKPEKLIRNQTLVLALLAAACLISAAGYILASRLVYKTGFPLDDAWIHQTFARNLGLYGEWSFLRGIPAAGSTSPLWTFLLAAGYMLGLSPYGWAMALGMCGLFLTAWAGQAFVSEIQVDAPGRWPWVAAFLGFEWHLVWAAVSGMETGVYGGLILVCFYLLARKRKHWLVIGLMAGGMVWVRPDAITLLGPILFVAALEKTSDLPTWKKAAFALAGFSLAFVPYLGFNLSISGSIWPNTFYAKQAEYAVLYQTPLILRFLNLARLPLVGAGVLLLPGFAASAYQSVKQRNFILMSAILWWLGYTGIYAARLPVTYQHGRYLIPAMCVYFVIGAAGMLSLAGLNLPGKWAWGLKTLWKLSFAGVLLVFWGVGANAYGEDVAIIETEMVDTAHWLNENTQPGDLIAVHDIGAIGYFSERSLVDLAGLVSPEVVPYIRDEDGLAVFMDERGVDYLVTFPGWYPRLSEGRMPVYRSDAQFAPNAGGENMAVYRWEIHQKK